VKLFLKYLKKMLVRDHEGAAYISQTNNFSFLHFEAMHRKIRVMPETGVEFFFFFFVSFQM
jgi:hypothetical protein